MAPGWQVMADTVAGTLKLREQGVAYLPAEPAEKDEHYRYRRWRAVFFNAVDRTLNGLVGMVYRNDPKLNDNVPEVIRGREAEGETAAVEGQWENIDNAGTHGVVFTKEVFADAMRDGHAAILVDMPPALADGATLADERAANRRPYWVSYCAEQIINWRTEAVGGQTRFSMVVLKECSLEPDGLYGQKEVTRYRVLRPGSWELWRKETQPREDIVFEDSGETSLTEIPLAVVYSRKTDILTSQPPLLDLALINIAHYQKYSDFSNYLHIASRPLLWFRGRDTSKKVEAIGAYTYFDVGDNGEVAFAETTGAALGGASEDIKDLEQRMSILGLSLLVKQTGAGGPETATEERNDQIEESSDLATAARSLKDAIELALRFHTQYLTPKATTGGNIELGASLDDLTLSPEEMNAYSSMVGANQLSVETMWAMLAAAGKLPADFDPKSERTTIEKDAQAAADRMMQAADRAPMDQE